METQAPVVQVSRDGGVLRLTLDRPEVRNAIDDRVVAAITEGVAEAAADPGVRAVVIAATGKVFSSGADLSRLRGLAGATREASLADATASFQMLRTVFTSPKPVVAAVRGAVHGAAVGLVCACDVVVATEGSHFATAEARLGLAPLLLAPYFVAAIGARAARYHLLTGARMEAEDALRLGLVHLLVAEEALETAVSQVVAGVMRGGPVALHSAKRALAEGLRLPLTDEEIAVAAGAMADARGGAEAREGVAAFLEKRAPVWPA